MVKFVDVYKGFGEKQVLGGLCFQVEAGVRVGLFAPSGRGKSTLLHLAAGLMAPDKGQVMRKTGARVSVVFQEDRLLPWCSAEKNIALCNRTQLPASYFLQQLGLGGEEESLPEALSGGMCRRVALGRALAFDGEIFLLDEALKGLDAALKQEITPFLKERFAGKTLFYASHDMEEIATFCTHLLDLDKEQLVDIG